MNPAGSLLREGETVWRILPAERLGLVLDSADFMRAFRLLARSARESILTVGWDLDAREDISDRRPGEPPCRLGLLIDQLVRENEHLRAHVLSWSPSVLYMLERDPFLLVRMGWLTHDRVRFELDRTAPTGASHHMKLSVFDDASALCGGIDLTNHRWDTAEHLPGDPRRVTPRGLSYAPYHDVDLLVQGEAAAGLGEVVRERWQAATGKRISAPAAIPPAPWPLEEPAELEHVEVGIVRTLPSFTAGGPVSETEAFLTAAIAAAQECIYLENQYVTSPTLIEALCARLCEPEGPDVVCVVPKSCAGWLEEETMGTLMAASVADLQQADHYGRLRVKWPKHGDTDVFVHAKLLVVDNRALYVGSANATMRSLSLDTECGLVVDAAGDPRVTAGVTRIASRLVGHHLGLAPREVERRREAGTRLRDLVDLAGPRRLEDARYVERTTQEYSVDPDMLRAVADPREPLSMRGLLEATNQIAERNDAALEALSEEERRATTLERRRRRVGQLALAGFVLAVVAGLVLAALYGDDWSAKALVGWLGQLRGTWSVAVPVTVLIFVVAGTLALPLNPLIIGAGAAFGPLAGAGMSLVGAMLSAGLSYGIGRLSGHALSGWLSRFERPLRKIRDEGILAVAAVRLLPLAPFPVVNMAAGAVSIRFTDFLIGTAIGLAPGLTLMSLFGGQLEKLLNDPSWSMVGWTAVVLLAAVVVLFIARKLARNKLGEAAG